LRRSYVNHAPERDSTAALVVGDYEFDSAGMGGWVRAETVGDFGGRESDLGIDSTGFSYILGGHGKERDFSREEVYNVRYDFVSQVTNKNQIKLGFEINYDKMHLLTGLVQYSPPMVKMNSFDREPITIAIYAQDKIEFSNMIANLGLRFDYTDRSGTYYTDHFSTLYTVDSILYAPTANIKPYYRISPRLGISHPISDRSKLFFNYGHFYDEPSVNQLYVMRQRESGYYDYIPNSNLKPQKTIAYELGFDQQVGRAYLLHFSGFYRDITDQIKSVTYVNDLGTSYYSYNNDNYEDIRGLEILLEKAIGSYFVGSISYDYLVRSSGNVGYSIVYESSEKTPVESSHTQYAYPNFNILINMTFKTPFNFCRYKMLNDWNWNITHEYRDGKYITWNPENLPGVVYNYHWRPHINTNTRLSKVFKIGNVSTQLYLEVTNVFNRKEMTPYLRSYLLPNLKLYTEYMNSLEEGDRPGDYKKSYIKLPDSKYFPTQLLFLNPRRFYVGIHVNL
jgi:outer membrane receptor protein involved in Fe transport